MHNFIMKSRIHVPALFATLILATLGLPSALAQAVATSGQLSITGDIPRLTLSLDDLRHQPRITVKVPNRHQANTQDTYEGVPLAKHYSKQTGMPQGSQIKGAMLATYLLAEGSDGYQRDFSLAEVDSDFQDSEFIVADTIGRPLSVTAGPLKLVIFTINGRLDRSGSPVNQDSKRSPK